MAEPGVPRDPEVCAACGGRAERTEKDTSSGRHMETWTCAACGRSEVVDGGTALWVHMSEAARQNEELRLRSASAPKAPASPWSRLRARLRALFRP